MPDTPAPIFCRNSHSSTTCGSVRRVPDLGDALGARGRQQRRLGAGDRRLVEVHRRALQAVRRLEHVVGALRSAARPSPRSASRCVPNRPARRKVAAGRRDVRAARRARAAVRAAAPSRAAGPPARDRARACARAARGPAASCVPMPSTSAPRSSEQPRHHLDVADARHVGEHALVLGQQAGGEQRQRGVLVAFDGHAALEPVAAFDEQCRHQGCAFQQILYDRAARLAVETRRTPARAAATRRSRPRPGA